MHIASSLRLSLLPREKVKDDTIRALDICVHYIPASVRNSTGVWLLSSTDSDLLEELERDIFYMQQE